MGQKYVIELEEMPFTNEANGDKLWRVKGFNSLVFDEEGLKKLCTLRHETGIVNDARFVEGFERGKDKGIDIGNAEMWGIVRAIMLLSNMGGMTYTQLEDCFGTSNPNEIFTMPWEVIKDKYYQWQQKKKKEEENEFHVNDEVESNDGKEKYVVTDIAEGVNCTFLRGIDANGKWCSKEKNRVHKTGRVINVQMIMDVLKGE